MRYIQWTRRYLLLAIAALLLAYASSAAGDSGGQPITFEMTVTQITDERGPEQRSNAEPLDGWIASPAARDDGTGTPGEGGR